MFYEDKFEDGQWWCRGTPRGDWKPFTVADYCYKIKRLQAELNGNYKLWDMAGTATYHRWGAQ